tara:strand:+ start:3212 stop:3679 length:468 start_codon:yes stop_codon:yes gene_type:complete
MATTVTTANCTVTITESYDLNGVNYGNTTAKSFIDKGQVSQRIMEVAGKTGEGTVFTDILNLSTADSAGTVVKGEYAYFRITNLDDTNSVYLRIYNGADYLYFAITAGTSLFLMNANVDATTAVGVVHFAEIQAIAGQSSHATEGVDIEFIMVTT